MGSKMFQRFVILLVVVAIPIIAEEEGKENFEFPKMSNKTRSINDVDFLDADQKLQFLTASGLCPVKYMGMCFWGIFRGTSSTNFAEAELYCREKGGELADVYSRLHFNALVSYASPWTRTKEGPFGVWTAMLVYTSDGSLVLSDGTSAPYVLWLDGYPLTGGDNMQSTRAAIDIYTDHGGFVNIPPQTTKFGALCQISI